MGTQDDEREYFLYLNYQLAFKRKKHVITVLPCNDGPSVFRLGCIGKKLNETPNKTAPHKTTEIV